MEGATAAFSPALNLDGTAPESLAGDSIRTPQDTI
jgi:hypothetical protein